MKKKKNLNYKRIFILTFVIVLIAVLVTTIITIDKKNEKKGVFSILEKRWIEKNESKIIDISILNNVPIFGNQGEGVFFDFLNDFTKENNIQFNMIPYTLNGSNDLKDYSFRVTTSNNLNEDELLFYTDNYVLVSKNNQEVKRISDLGETTIGTLETDLNKTKDYLSYNDKLIYNTYSNIDAMVTALNNNDIIYAIMPKTEYINEIFENNYFIVYNFSEMTTNYVLKIGGEEKTFNSILRKYYTRWSESELSKSYNSRLLNLYFEEKNIDDETIANFSGKEYVYGYVKNLPYDSKINEDFIGYNSEVLDEFAKSMNITFKIKEYGSIKELEKNMNNGKVDLAFNYYNFDNLKEDFDSTFAIYDSKVVVLTSVNDVATTVPSIRSLKGKTVSMLDNKTATYFSNKMGLTVKKYKKVNNLFNALDDSSIILLDYNLYNYYRNNELSDYKVVFEDRIKDLDYNYLIHNSSENKAFNGLFKFYVSIIDSNLYEARAMVKLSKDSKKLDLTFVYIVCALFVVLTISLIYMKIKSNKNKISKTDRMKYVDSLTSLKNRHYLNKNYEKWQQNKIYPQAIIIVDVNKIGHINDVYGHEEGDAVIKKAANMLINNQLEQSDIVRTNGDEFLIYLVGYEENKVIQYIRKLYKEFKNLPYNFGATLGYSMILDDIKTIDDAINEAVLEVKTNKEMDIENKK